MTHHNPAPDPLNPLSHEPNPAPPTDNPAFDLLLPNGRFFSITVNDLQHLPATTVHDCYIVSTGHGTTGPFSFTGTTLLDLILQYYQQSWSTLEVVSADGFGNRVLAAELHQPDAAGPILLAYQLDEQPLSREQGLVRMIVPGERDDALRQVKWIRKITVVKVKA